jgi:hypothetical protein
MGERLARAPRWDKERRCPLDDRLVKRATEWRLRGYGLEALHPPFLNEALTWPKFGSAKALLAAAKFRALQRHRRRPARASGR